MPLADRSAQIGALYQEMILDHYRRPRNKGDMERADQSVLMKNPLCGDEIGVHVRFDGNTICELSFSGRGCSISLASASMMTQLVKGKPVAYQQGRINIDAKLPLAPPHDFDRGNAFNRRRQGNHPVLRNVPKVGRRNGV